MCCLVRFLRAEQIISPKETVLLVGVLAPWPATACSHLSRPWPPPLRRSAP